MWRCVTLIADLGADMAWTEWSDQSTKVEDVHRLVAQPLATMLRGEWTWRVLATEALWSSTHLLHVGGLDDDGVPFSLLPLPPQIVQPERLDPYGLLPPSSYRVGGYPEPIPASSMSVVRRTPFPGVPDYLNGILNLARRTFTGYLAADVAHSRYWLAGGPTTTVITTDQELTDPEAQRLGQRWVDRRSMGADFPAVLGKGAKAEPWGADPTREASVEARKEINADVGRFFGVPTRILNAPAGDSETYSNNEHDAVDLLRYTLRGYLRPLEDVISDLLPGDTITGHRMAMDPSQLVSGDLASRATAWSAIVAAGIADPDEARVRGFGLPPRPASSQPAPAGVSVAVTGQMAGSATR